MYYTFLPFKNNSLNLNSLRVVKLLFTVRHTVSAECSGNKSNQIETNLKQTNKQKIDYICKRNRFNICVVEQEMYAMECKRMITLIGVQIYC